MCAGLLALADAGGCATSRGPEDVGPEASTASASAKQEADNAPLTPSEIDAIVDAADRTEEDRDADRRRAPRALLEFLQIRRGMRVADLGAGFGYTTELLARAVGPTGVVYGQNPRFVLERFAEKAWSERLARPINRNVRRLDREFDDPFPEDVVELDLVVNVLFFHDFEWMGVDRRRHLAAVFAALRPGGRYVIVDASAAAGAGASGSWTLHRVEESLVVAELEAGGFRLVAEGDFLRNPSDRRDWNALPWVNERGEFSDKFVLAFERPRTP